MNPKEIKQEIERCKDPRYFYNKYITHPGKLELSQEEWDARLHLKNTKNKKLRK